MGGGHGREAMRVHGREGGHEGDMGGGHGREAMRVHGREAYSHLHCVHSPNFSGKST